MIQKTIKILTSVSFALCIGIFAMALSVTNSLPDSFYVPQGEEFEFSQNIPVTAVKLAATQGAAKSVSTGAEGEQYQVDLKLLGAIPIKTAQVQVISPVQVVPSGEAFGIKIYTDGVMIVGMTAVDTADGTVNSAELAGLNTGDVLLAIDGKTVASNSDVADIVEASQGKALTITARRDNVSFSVEITPVKSKDENKYKVGLWVRDSCAGIGTLTYYQPSNNTFAGLGHAVCDVDTGKILPLMTGEIVGAEITGITKGKSGVTGELRGRFIEEKKLGSLLLNTASGVYGYSANNMSAGQSVTVAMRQQVKTGKAEVLACVDGTPTLYECSVEAINLKDTASLQNMIIKITDERLLEKTGGIVQGMSGSPILQDGMLIGAVTHVFVNDPTKGYGIFAENMLSETERLKQNSLAPKAS